jgi:hypothetical protein
LRTKCCNIVHTKKYLGISIILLKKVTGKSKTK